MTRARTAELLGALSLGTDLSTGFPPEAALRTAICAARLAKVLGLDGAAVKAAYYAGVLRFLGCTAVAHETSKLAGGDDIDFLQTYADVDFGSPAAVAGRTLRRLARGKGAIQRATLIASFLSDPKGGARVSTAHCALATELADRLGMDAVVKEALLQMYERWDGKGEPRHLRGDAIGLVARTLHAATECEVHRRMRGPTAAAAEITRRRGAHFDPRVARALVDHLQDVTRGLAAPSVWDVFLDEEPQPYREEGHGDRRRIAHAFATFVDLKSPFTITHSPRVAELATAAYRGTGASDLDQQELEAAALLHDLGRAGVPNGIWDKPDALNSAEWERVRGHAHATERILSQSSLLHPLADLAAADHERCDGTGYPRRVPRALLPIGARILAATDVYVALQEDRAHRPGISKKKAIAVLLEEVAAGRLCSVAVDALLAADGLDERVARAFPCGLTEREIDVLVLVAQGLTNKEIGTRLSISARTVQTHLAHVFDKTGARTRAAAAMFTATHGLVARAPSE